MPHTGRIRPYFVLANLNVTTDRIVFCFWRRVVFPGLVSNLQESLTMNFVALMILAGLLHWSVVASSEHSCIGLMKPQMFSVIPNILSRVGLLTSGIDDLLGSQTLASSIVFSTLAIIFIWKQLPSETLFIINDCTSVLKFSAPFVHMFYLYRCPCTTNPDHWVDVIPVGSGNNTWTAAITRLSVAGSSVSWEKLCAAGSFLMTELPWRPYFVDNTGEGIFIFIPGCYSL